MYKYGEKTVFNIKVSEQYFDHSNKDCEGNTSINCGEMHVECYCTIHYVQQNERMER